MAHNGILKDYPHKSLKTVAAAAAALEVLHFQVNTETTTALFILYAAD